MGETEKPAPAGNQHLETLKKELSRVRIEPVSLGAFPEPPDEKGLGLGLTVGGALMALGGLWLVWMGITTMIGVLLAGGLGGIAYGGLLVLYGQFRGPLATRPMPGHPSSRPGDVRSVWETAATVTLVLGVLNVPLLLIVAGLAGVMVHWAASLLLVVGLNAVALPFAYRGDGTNRRPIPSA